MGSRRAANATTTKMASRNHRNVTAESTPGSVIWSLFDCKESWALWGYGGGGVPSLWKLSPKLWGFFGEIFLQFFLMQIVPHFSQGKPAQSSEQAPERRARKSPYKLPCSYSHRKLYINYFSTTCDHNKTRKVIWLAIRVFFPFKSFKTATSNFIFSALEPFSIRWSIILRKALS